MTRHRRPGLLVERLEDRYALSGTTVPAGQFNWTQFSPAGELGQLVWQGHELVYRSRADGAWQAEAVGTATAFTREQYDTRDQVEKASRSAQLVFTGDGTPHALVVDPVWNAAYDGFQTAVRHYARTGGAWQLVETVTAPWLSTWGPVGLVAEAGPNNSLHFVFSETYQAATGVGNAGTGILWHATNATGTWEFARVADTADPKTDVWFTGGRWAPRFVSLAVDAKGFAHVTYTPQFHVAGAFSTVYSELRYASNQTGAWKSELVVAPADGTADAGLGASVAVAPNGQVAVASYYVDRYATGSPQSSKLMYHTRTGAGKWARTDVATRPDGYVAGDGAKFTGFAPQLEFDGGSRPMIVFSDEAGEHLKESYANEFAGQIRVATLSGGKWTIKTVFRQTDPVRNQLFYPVAAVRNGQTVFAGLKAVSVLDKNKNPTRTDFSLVEVGTPAGPGEPITVGTASPSAPPDDGPVRTVVNAPGVVGVDGQPAAPTAAAAATAADPRPGVMTTVAVFRSDGALDFTLTPFGDGYTGGARIARGDINGDGVPDVIVGSGGGMTARVRGWDGRSRGLIFDVAPFDGFTGSAEVAVGDITGDGRADVVIGPGAGGGPRVQVWTASGDGFAKARPDFFGLPYPEFRGGLRVAAGDLDRDGFAELIVAPGEGGGPRVTVFDGESFGSAGGPRLLVNDFLMFDGSARTGLHLSAGDLDGDGYADVIAGSGAGGGPRVRAVSGRALAAGGGPVTVADFFAADPAERAGARVGVTDAGGGRMHLLTGTAGGRLTVFAGTEAVRSVPAFATPGGLYVG